MPFPPVPKSYQLLTNKGEVSPDNLNKTIENILIYLQRLKDGAFDEIISILENNPEIILAIIFSVLQDSATIDFITIDNHIEAEVIDNAITYAKIQQVNTAKLLGNPTGILADVQEITLGSGLQFVGSTLNIIETIGNSRVVPLSSILRLADTFSLVISRYFTVLGTLILEGDACLEII